MTDCLVATARVVAVHDDGRLSVELPGPQACVGCRCGRPAFSGACVAELPLDAAVPVRAGEAISISMPVRSILRGAMWLHGIPWAGLLAGAAAGAAAGYGDLGCLLGAGIGLGIALGLLGGMRSHSRAHAMSGLRIAGVG